MSQKSFTPYQKFVVAVLAFLQFTIVLDFMILSPLGAILIPAMKITPGQFGWVVSAYAFSAGLSGVLAAGFADRFDRKKLLLFFYMGFVLGTLMCALAPDYPSLLVARMVTGLFGGVIGSIVYAIATDLFPMSMRGRVMGFVQTAFAASQVLGLPLGLFMANRWGWHTPFLLIVGVAAAVGVAILVRLSPIDGHLSQRSDKSASRHLWHTVTQPRYIQGFATTAFLSAGGFMLMPFASAFLVHNVGIPLATLPLIYVITGACSIVVGPLVGRASDSFGKFPVFFFGSVLTAITVAAYTNLGPSSVSVVVAVNVVMWIGISSRIISSSALMSALPEPGDRGSFMAVSASLQQLAGGVAAAVAGLIVAEGEGGTILRYDVVGYVVIAAAFVTLAMMYWIDAYIREHRTEKPGSVAAMPAEG